MGMTAGETNAMSDRLMTSTRDMTRLGRDSDATDTRRHGIGVQYKLGQNVEVMTRQSESGNLNRNP